MVWSSILHRVAFASLISLPNAFQGTQLLVCLDLFKSKVNDLGYSIILGLFLLFEVLQYGRHMESLNVILKEGSYIMCPLKYIASTAVYILLTSFLLNKLFHV